MRLLRLIYYALTDDGITGRDWAVIAVGIAVGMLWAGAMAAANL
jgi:hypothetical protein